MAAANALLRAGGFLEKSTATEHATSSSSTATEHFTVGLLRQRGRLLVIHERFVAATRAAAAVARQREEDVLCLVASQLALFTGAIPVLELCRGQDRTLWMRILYMRRRDMQVSLQYSIAKLPLPSPISMILATPCEPTRLMVDRLFFCDLGKALLATFFDIWHVVRYKQSHWSHW